MAPPPDWPNVSLVARSSDSDWNQRLQWRQQSQGMKASIKSKGNLIRLRIFETTTCLFNDLRNPTT